MSRFVKNVQLRVHILFTIIVVIMMALGASGSMGAYYANPDPNPEYGCYDDEDGGPPEDPNNPEPCDDDTCWCASPYEILNGYLCNCQGGSPVQLIPQGTSPEGPAPSGGEYVNPNPDPGFMCVDDEDGGPPGPNNIEPCDDSTCWCADPADIMNGYVCNCVGGSPQQLIPQGHSPEAPQGGEYVNPNPDPGFMCVDDEDGGPPDPNNPEPCDDDTCWCADPSDILNGYMCNCQAGTPQPVAEGPTFNGDANRDGKVNIKDLLSVAMSFGKSIFGAQPSLEGDMNGDGKVNIFDLVVVARNLW